MSDETRAKNLELLPGKAKDLMSDDVTILLEAVVWFRKTLSVERRPPIDEVLAAGALPRLIELLAFTSSVQIQFEAAWAVTNIASGTSEHTRRVIETGALPLFIKHLSSDNADLREQSIWALGNIAGDSAEFRDMVLASGALEPMVKIAFEYQQLSLLRNTIWALSNLFRGTPHPQKKLVKPALALFAHVLLQRRDTEAAIDSLWGLCYYSEYDEESPNDIVELGLMNILIERILARVTHDASPVVQISGNIAKVSEAQAQLLLTPAVKDAFNFYLKSNANYLVKETCRAISHIIFGKPHRIDAIVDKETIETFFSLVEGQNNDVRAEAMIALTNIIAGGSKENIEVFGLSKWINVIYRIILDADDQFLPVILDGFEICLKSMKVDNFNVHGDHYISNFDDIGGFDRIKHLLMHSNPEVKSKAKNMIDTFFTIHEAVVSIKMEELEREFNESINGGALFFKNKYVLSSFVM